MELGLKLPALVGTDERGAPTTVEWAADSITVLLVFHSQCVFCEQVAPTWREWLESEPPARTFLLSRDLLGDAVKFRDDHDWSGDLLVVAPATPYELSARLTSNTPWIYLVSPNGELLHEGHGADLAAVDQLLSSRYGI
jgi:hypothetical protein